MKDAKGHGSAAHQGGVESIPDAQTANLIAYHSERLRFYSQQLMKADYGSTRKLKGYQDRMASHEKSLKVLMGEKS